MNPDEVGAGGIAGEVLPPVDPPLDPPFPLDPPEVPPGVPPTMPPAAVVVVAPPEVVPPWVEVPPWATELVPRNGATLAPQAVAIRATTNTSNTPVRCLRPSLRLCLRTDPPPWPRTTYPVLPSTKP